MYTAMASLIYSTKSASRVCVYVCVFHLNGKRVFFKRNMFFMHNDVLNMKMNAACCADASIKSYLLTYLFDCWRRTTCPC